MAQDSDGSERSVTSSDSPMNMVQLYKSFDGKTVCDFICFLGCDFTCFLGAKTDKKASAHVD